MAKNKKIKNHLIWIIGLPALLFASGYFWVFIFSLLLSPCGVESVDSILSPDASKKVEVFIVDCGATTDWSTQVSILNSNEVVGQNTRGNVMRLGGKQQVIPTWAGLDSVEILYDDSKIFKQVEEVDGVSISYALN